MLKECSNLRGENEFILNSNRYAKAFINNKGK